MVEADFSGDYINTENTHKGDILTIVGEAKPVELVKKDGSVKLVWNIPVENNGLKKIYTPSRDSGKAIVKAWGKETISWIGHKLQADTISYKSFGETKQMIEALPLM